MEFNLTHDLIALAWTALLTIAVVALHYETLHLLSRIQSRRWRGHVNVGVMIICIIVVHCLETLIFAAGYWFASHGLNLGQLTGSRDNSLLLYVYFALETYTTQSPGDIIPIGPIRLIASLEPLVGLILIGWSTSFTFLVMRREGRVGRKR